MTQNGDSNDPGAASDGAARPPAVIRVDGLAVELAARRVLRDGVEVPLTPSEFRLLAMLAGSSGRFVGYEALLAEVLDRRRSIGIGNTPRKRLNAFIELVARLRRKLGEDGSAPRFIHVLEGVGLRFGPPARAAEDLLRVGGVELDAGGWAVWVDGAEVDLTRIEFRLLAALMRSAGRVVSREALIAEAWGDERAHSVMSRNVLSVYVGRVRRKLGEDGSAPRFIHVLEGVGLRFGPPARAAEDLLRVGGVELDAGGWAVWVDGAEVDLTRIEFRLLAALMRSAGRVVSREALVAEAWGDERAHSVISRNELSVYVLRVRRKLVGDDASSRCYIQVRRGVGYLFVFEDQTGAPTAATDAAS